MEAANERRWVRPVLVRVGCQRTLCLCAVCLFIALGILSSAASKNHLCCDFSCCDETLERSFQKPITNPQSRSSEVIRFPAIAIWSVERCTDTFEIVMRNTHAFCRVFLCISPQRSIRSPKSNAFARKKNHFVCRRPDESIASLSLSVCLRHSFESQQQAVLSKF